MERRDAVVVLGPSGLSGAGKQARGAPALAPAVWERGAARAGVPSCLKPPVTVRQAVSGRGRAAGGRRPAKAVRTISGSQRRR